MYVYKYTFTYRFVYACKYIMPVYIFLMSVCVHAFAYA